MVVWNKKRATGIGPSGRLDLRYCAENKPNGFKEEKAELFVFILYLFNLFYS